MDSRPVGWFLRIRNNLEEQRIRCVRVEEYGFPPAMVFFGAQSQRPRQTTTTLLSPFVLLFIQIDNSRSNETAY